MRREAAIPSSGPCRARRSRRPEAGFSLLEMVVAVALIALLGVVAMEAARFMRVNYQRSLAASDALGETQALRGLFAHLLASAQPLALEDDEGRAAVFFDGDAERLTLLAPYAAVGGFSRRRDLAALAAQPGLAVFSLGVAPLEDGAAALLLGHAPFAARGEGAQALAGAVILVGPIKGAVWRYFGADAEEEAEDATWREAWPLSETTPLAVSLSIEGGGFDASAPLVAQPPRVGGE